ncbi:hypothetical protein DDP54_09975 [Cellulomonas sp. WB94]|nr:hypothetical protein DDP54_09975 [Cellulomonas sp. WB94]
MVAATLLVGLLAGCSSSSPGLEVLRADPMATATPAGLTSQSVSEDAGGVTFGIRQPCSLLRTLHLTDPVSALVELDQGAQDAGWAARAPLDLTVTPAAAFYKRTVDGRPLELTLTWDGTDEVVQDLSTP